MFEETRRAEEAWQRQEAIEAARRKVEELEQGGRPEEALRLLEAIQQEFGPEPGLEEAQVRLTQRSEFQRRVNAVRQAIAEVHQLVGQDRADSAIIKLRQAASLCPDDDATRRLVRGAQNALQTLQRKQSVVRRLMEDCRSLAAAGQPDEAIERVERGLEAYPCEPALVEMHAQLKESRTAQARRERILAVAEQAEAFRQNGQFSQASNLVAQAIRELGADPALTQLQRLIQAGIAEARGASRG
jgi:tetratricopeptide (TPR) repeat protein